MEARIVHLPALLLSAAVHSGLWFAAGPSGHGNNSVAGPVGPATMNVELRRENAPAESPSQHSAEQLADHYETAQEPAVPPVAETNKLLPIVAAPEPYYFRTSQLTQKPRVLKDVSEDLILVLPELPDQVAILRLFINDDGLVDKVVVEDSHLPEAAERRVLDAFSKIGFQPGKIGRIAVRSQLRIEVRTADFSFPRNKLAVGASPASPSGN